MKTLLANKRSKEEAEAAIGRLEAQYDNWEFNSDEKSDGLIEITVSAKPGVNVDMSDIGAMRTVAGEPDMSRHIKSKPEEVTVGIVGGNQGGGGTPVLTGERTSD